MLAAIAVAPLLAHLCVPVRFNQFMVQRYELQHGRDRPRELGRLVRSAYSSGLNVLSLRPRWRAPALDDAREMFEYVFSWLPSRAIVYPTEAVYYFSLVVEGRAVWGNVGAASLEQGVVDFSYFTRPGEWTSLSTFSLADGVRVTRVSERVHEVTYGGRSVVFELSDSDLERPRRLALIPDEELVGHVLDESAIKFFLLFNRLTWSFYYVLDEEHGASDRLQPLGESLLVGRRTGFVYFPEPDHDRKLLVGVSLHNVMLNNYFDGPCDQVPYRAPLRDRLHLAYPNTMLGDGIDEHGVLVDREPWERVAICAFRRYSSLSDLEELYRGCSPAEPRSVYWSCLTKEWWNTPFWRQRMSEALRAEGKTPPPAPPIASRPGRGA